MSTSLAPEVRIKLHIKSSNEPEVKNVWMCLNYDQKPSILHIIEHVKKHFCHSDKKSADLDELMPEIKLYMDNYWLPPSEDSRLLRENDCIKVELNMIEPVKVDQTKKAAALNNKNLTLLESENNLSNYNKSKASIPSKNVFNSKLNEEKIEAITGVPANYDYDNYNANYEYYNHYYDNNYELQQAKHQQPQPLINKAQPKLNPYNYWLNNEYQTNQTVEEPVKEDTYNKSKSNKIAPVKSQKETNKTIAAPKPAVSALTKSKVSNETAKPAAPANKSTKEISNCYRKFAIGSYAHLLNDISAAPAPVAAIETTQKGDKKKTNNQKKFQEEKYENEELSEEQLIDSYYQSLQEKQPLSQKSNKNQAINEQSADFDKIASNVNSTGRQKWKNSTQPTKSNGPKHIIFPTSSSSEDSSSDSSSSSESEQEAKKSKAPAVVTTAKNVPKKAAEVAKKPQYYEPTKEEQLNSVSYNRSYVIKNTKALIDFKKIFNEEKLNAPQAEEFADKSEYPKETAAANVLDVSTTSSMDTSTTSGNGSSSLTEGEKKETQGKRSPRHRTAPVSPRIDYEKYEKLVGAPRPHDKIAFQILEISSNFTPEISEYKTGVVTEFDQTTNEITLILNNKYNQVLKKPSKFTVILDDNEENLTAQQDESSQESIADKRRISQEAENTLKVDWRNLINLKLLPNEQEMPITSQ